MNIRTRWPTSASVIHDRAYGPGFFSAGSLFFIRKGIPDWGVGAQPGPRPAQSVSFRDQALGAKIAGKAKETAPMADNPDCLAQGHAAANVADSLLRGARDRPVLPQDAGRSLHVGIGQEGVAVGVASALGESDYSTARTARTGISSPAAPIRTC